jgi:hypothetical protein
MSRIKTENLQDELLKKKERYNIRVTTYLEGLKITTLIKGSVKNRFLDDCIKREFNESKMASHVIETYYAIIDSNPEIRDKEIPEIKNWIIKNIKL